MRVLQALGMGKAVEQAGAVVRRWGFFDQHGEVLCDTDLEAMWGGMGPCIGIESLFLRPAIRNAAFRERGDQEMHNRYAPLIPAP